MDIGDAAVCGVAIQNMVDSLKTFDTSYLTPQEFKTYLEFSSLVLAHHQQCLGVLEPLDNIINLELPKVPLVDSVVFMDVIEARRNIKRYQTNVSALLQVHLQDLSVDELNTITAIIKKQNRLINNIEESLQESKRR